MTDRDRRWFGARTASLWEDKEPKLAAAGGSSLSTAGSQSLPDPTASVSAEGPATDLSSGGDLATSGKAGLAEQDLDAADSTSPGDADDDRSPVLDESWIRPRTPRERSLLILILTQSAIRKAVARGPVVELRASADEFRSSLLPIAASVTVNSGDSHQSQADIQALKGELSVLFLNNSLQFLTETRRFLGLCFSKLSVGGLLMISVPHQFLYERKLRLPSRRNPLHRRFYTANTLMSEVEEAIDPSESRVRFLGESDAGYPVFVGLEAEPEGGQDILLALERTVLPPWRSELDADELWAEAPTRPAHCLPLVGDANAPLRVIAPDPYSVRRVIALKLDHRGDFLMATEAFKTLRHAFADAELTLVCGSWNVAEARNSGLFDVIVAFDFFPEDDSAREERPPREALVAGFAEQMRGKSYDLAVDLRLYDDSRDLLKAIDARNRAGFDRYDSFPWLTIRLNMPSPTVDDRAERGVITAAQFHTTRGAHKTYEIAFDAAFRPQEIRTIVWGPYQELKPGRYQLDVLIEPFAADFEIPFDIVRDSGSRTVMAGLLQVARGRFPRLELQVDERIPEFEFRLVGTPALEVLPFRFLGLGYLRPSVIRGTHQSEAMALLARLVELRLRDAYVSELL